MGAELFAIPLTALIHSGNQQEIYFNDSNAAQLGINMRALRSQFQQATGKEILNNETVKIAFDLEGDYLDFSTFDGATIRVPFNDQAVAPNKGGDGPVPY